MLNVKQNNSNICFYGRNQEIRQAQKILHKIKADFPASSSYVADLLMQKRDMKLEFSNRLVNISDAIERNNSNDKIGAKLANNNVGLIRKLQKYYLEDDFRYCDSLIWGIEKFRVMNCKENSELAFLIAKMNGYKDCYCANLAGILPDSTVLDLDHSVLLINQELPHNIEKLDKFYGENVSGLSAFLPSRKAIVVDPIFGIVDYWDNAVQNYKTIFPKMSEVKKMCAGVREMIIKSPRDIKDLKHSHPKLMIHPQEKVDKPNIFNRIINYLKSKFDKMQ